MLVRTGCFIAFCYLGFVGADFVRAEEPKFKKIELTVSPAPVPRPALKYRFQPAVFDQHPGNAAQLYLRAIVLLKLNADFKKEATQDQVLKWLEMPAADLPKKEVHEFLDATTMVLHEVRMAVRRTTCDWDLPFREEENVISMLLPEVQELRSLARLLALQARLQIAEGKFEDAVESIGDGLTLGIHAAEAPLLINGLVAVAISAMMIDEINELQRTPGAPNLYWALTTLPDPLVDLRRAYNLEGSLGENMFPQLQHVEKAERSDEQWRVDAAAVQAKILKIIPLASSGEENSNNDPWKKMATQLAEQTWLTLTAIPRSKAGLVDLGMDRKQVEEMPGGRALLLYMKLTYDDYRDDAFRWMHLPYWQAIDGLRAADERLKTEGRGREVIPLASLLLPAVRSVRRAEVRLQRNLAAARTVETLRMHLAANERKWPEKLEDVKVAPVPLDPFVGKLPKYTLGGQAVTLDYAEPPGGDERDRLQIILKLRETK